MKSSYFKSGFILSYAAIFIQSAVSVIYTPVMLRLLGRTDYGLLQLAVSAIANLGILSFGFGSSYLRFYSQYKSENNSRAIASLNGMFALIFVAASVVALAAGLTISYNAEFIFHRSMTFTQIQTLKTLLAIMSVNLFLTLPLNIFDSFIISHERFTFQKTLVIITTLLNPMLAFPFILAGKGSIYAALAITAVSLIKLVTSMIFCIAKLKMKFAFRFDLKLFRRLFVFSFFVFLNIISDQINWNADKTILGILKGADSVTHYSLGSQFNGYFLTFSYALTSLFSPRAYDLTVQRAHNELNAFFSRFGRIQLSVMAYIYMLLAAVGRPFIRIWSGVPSNVPYAVAMLLVSPLLITSIQSIGIEIQRAKDMHRFRSILYFFIALANIAVSVPLCLTAGEIGCAFGTCISLTAGNIIIMNIYYHKCVGLDMRLFWRKIAAMLPSLIPPAIICAASAVLARESILSIMIWATLLTAVYLPCVWFFGIRKDLLENNR